MSPPTLDELQERAGSALRLDRRRLERRLAGILRAQRAGKDTGHALEQVERDMIDALQRAEQMRAHRPAVSYPPDLPVAERHAEIAAAIRANPVVIVCGETGSGKTTQLPKICIDAGRGADGMIGHTQPRRIAARSVAARIAEELDSTVGEAVGYKVRFDDQTSDATTIKLMTDGILLAETQGDPWLDQYDTLIIDEAHERSLNIDFLLGYVKQLLTRRRDLRVVVTSATIDPERFSRHFGDAPIIEVSGRTWPVDVRYRPPDVPADGEVDWPQAINDALQELFAEGPGDALVFLPGERQIRETADHLRKHMEGLEIVPLFARLSPKDQQRVFQRHAGRRVVLATNVAETSLTVPGIHFVVDTGLARISRYSSQRKVQRLPIEPISQASAAQRSGRAGRLADGIAIRLYPERAFRKRDEFTAPEILRSNLAAVILQMKSLGLGDVESFPFLEPPRARMIRDGYLTLYELGAVTDEGELTDRGVALSRMPLDPRIGRMLLEAEERGCLAETLIIAAALSVRDPRERPPDARDDADAAHARFRHPDSDFLGMLKLWRVYRREREDRGSSQLRKWCRHHHLSHARLREWDDVRRQLTELVREAGLHINEQSAPSATVHRAVLAGLLVNIGRKGDKYAYSGTHDSTFWLWPGSALADVRPKWIVAAERVETSRLFGRGVAPIDPAWVEPLAEHLVEHHYYDPHWNQHKGYVYAYERVTLFGLELVSQRRVLYGPIHPRRSREIFIRHALVHERWRTRAPFFRHNHRLLEEIRGLEARERRTGLLADADDRFAFYESRIPADITCGADLETWLRGLPRSDERTLHMERDDVLLERGTVSGVERHPDVIQCGALKLPATYRFEPGHPRDGVTLRVPLEAVTQLDIDRLDWLVPGYIHEKVVALLKSLPKGRRRVLVPLPDTADRLLALIDFGRGSLFEALSAGLERLGHARVPVAMWNTESLPPYLLMNLDIVDAKGKVLTSGRSLGALRRELFAKTEQVAAGGLDRQFEQSDLTSWTIGDLPERVPVVRGRTTVHGYPALVDAGDRAHLKALDTPERAHGAHRMGVARLLALALRKPMAAALRGVPDLRDLRLWYATLPAPVSLDQALGDRAIVRAADLWTTPVRTAAGFESALGRARATLDRTTREVAGLAHDILVRYHAVARKLMNEVPPAYHPSMEDMVSQVAGLVGGDWLRTTPWRWLAELPRFLDAIDMRLVRIGQGGLAKDRRNMETLARHLVRIEKRSARHAAEGVRDPELQTYRWMIEELRVLLFAQDLGTSLRISKKRLDEQWARVSG